MDNFGYGKAFCKSKEKAKYLSGFSVARILSSCKVFLANSAFF